MRKATVSRANDEGLHLGTLLRRPEALGIEAASFASESGTGFGDGDEI